MFGGSTLPAITPEPMSTKWHSVHANFLYLFRKSYIRNIEMWYNQIAPHKQRDVFRNVVKSIHEHVPKPVTDELVLHRAQHIWHLYAEVLADDVKDKVISWVSTVDSAMLEQFREAFTAVQMTFMPASTIKRTFVPLPQSQSPVDRRNFRKKIDWLSSKTSETMRNTTHNPMDEKHVVVEQDTSKAKKKRFVIQTRQEAAAEAAFKLLGVTEGTLDSLKEKRKGAIGETFSVNADGLTTYCSKQAKRQERSYSNRVVSTFSETNASSWTTTTRDFIRNHGSPKTSYISPDQHPAIARVTASLGLCVPNIPLRK